jgi:hypothetical protein
MAIGSLKRYNNQQYRVSSLTYRSFFQFTDMEPFVDSSGKFLFRQRKSSKAVDNFQQWLLAWNNDEFVLVSTNPAMYHELAIYRGFIQSCEQKCTWSAVYA